MGKKPTQRYSFDDSEFDSEPSTESSTNEYEEGVADTIVNSLSDGSEDIDDQLEDVEARLELASYYRVLLNNNPFNDDGPAATTVGNELKDFVKGRLRVLLGLRAEATVQAQPVELPFDDDEVRALKALAAKVLNKPVLLTEQKKVKGPSIRKVEAPTPPATKKQQPQQPQLRKAQPPAGAKPAPKKSQEKVIKGKDGSEYIEKGGKKYRKVVETGTWNTGEEETKEVLVDVTGQVRHPHAMPMPTGKAMEMVSMQKAAETLELAVEGNGELVNSAMVMSLRGS